MNHTTQNHWPGGKCPQKGKGQKSQKDSKSSGKKKADKKGKGKEKAQTSANTLDIADIGELSITSSESINFSCYETRVKQLNGSWIVGAPITSHQEKAILSNTGNLDNHIKQKLQTGNTSQLRVMEWLSDTAKCLIRMNHCKSETYYTFQRQISGFFR